MAIRTVFKNLENPWSNKEDVGLFSEPDDYTRIGASVFLDPDLSPGDYASKEVAYVLRVVDYERIPLHYSRAEAIETYPDLKWWFVERWPRAVGRYKLSDHMIVDLVFGKRTPGTISQKERSFREAPGSASWSKEEKKEWLHGFYGYWQNWTYDLRSSAMAEVIMGFVNELPERNRTVQRVVRHILSCADIENRKDALMVGRWTGEYGDGKEPSSWSCSYELYNHRLATGKPVRYVQCWVFSEVLTSAFRFLGIPSRTVYAINAHIDRHRDGGIDLGLVVTKGSGMSSDAVRIEAKTMATNIASIRTSRVGIVAPSSCKTVPINSKTIERRSSSSPPAMGSPLGAAPASADSTGKDGPSGGTKVAPAAEGIPTGRSSLASTSRISPLIPSLTLPVAGWSPRIISGRTLTSPGGTIFTPSHLHRNLDVRKSDVPEPKIPDPKRQSGNLKELTSKQSDSPHPIPKGQGALTIKLPESGRRESIAQTPHARPRRLERHINIPRVVGADDSSWNFHVWNEVWMDRPDLPQGYDQAGWQCLDASPMVVTDSNDSYRGKKMFGPCAVGALREGKDFEHDFRYMYSAVNSITRYWFTDGSGEEVVHYISSISYSQFDRERQTSSNRVTVSTRDPKHSYDRFIIKLDITNTYTPADADHAYQIHHATHPALFRWRNGTLVVEEHAKAKRKAFYVQICYLDEEAKLLMCHRQNIKAIKDLQIEASPDHTYKASTLIIDTETDEWWGQVCRVDE